MLTRRRIAQFGMAAWCARTAFATERGSRDPEFDRHPVSEWMAGAGAMALRWRLGTTAPMLSVHQRLLVRVDVRMDGIDVVKRRGEGQLLIFIEITDANGTKYQDHGNIDLAKIEEGLRASDMQYTQSVFVLPGDYQIATAIYDTATREHTSKHIRLRVAALKADPLPRAWSDLPGVEVVPQIEPPDLWYLPEVAGRLRLAVDSPPSMRVEAMVNLTAAERESGSLRVRNRNLAAILPSLKAITQVDFNGALLNASMLDLARRQLAFRQEDVQSLDWPGMRRALTPDATATIDVKALQERGRSAAFFVNEVARRAAAAEKETRERVVILLSGPVSFTTSQEPPPPLAPMPRVRVFYFRFYTARVPIILTDMEEQQRRTRRIPMPTRVGRAGPSIEAMEIDQLAGMLAPLSPRVFDVHSAFDFRKALAQMLDALAGR